KFRRHVTRLTKIGTKTMRLTCCARIWIAKPTGLETICKCSSRDFSGGSAIRRLFSEGHMKGALALLLSVGGLVQCASAAETGDGWVQLFNGRNFDGLEVYLAPPPGSKEPLGLNNDPH